MSTPQIAEKLTIAGLPLAVYREIAAHLQQVEQVEVELVPQSSQTFSYFQSQIEGLILRYPSNIAHLEQQRLQEILDYYETIHGHWERQEIH